MRITERLVKMFYKTNRPRSSLPYPEPYSLPDYYTQPMTTPPVSPATPEWAPQSTIESEEPEYNPTPMLYGKDPDRFVHYATCFSLCADPLPIVITPLITMTGLFNAAQVEGRRIALLVTKDNLHRAMRTLFMWETVLQSVLVACELDMLTSFVRGEPYMIIKQWCFTRNIQLGAYVYTKDDHVQVPRPKYRVQNTALFHFYILDSGVQDKYKTIQYMIDYLCRLGIDQRALIPLYLPYAQFPLQEANYGGYFFRKDICNEFFNRTGKLKDTVSDLPYNHI